MGVNKDEFNEVNPDDPIHVVELEFFQFSDQLDENFIRHESVNGNKEHHIEYEYALSCGYEKYISNCDIFQYVHESLIPLKVECTDNAKYDKWRDGVSGNMYDRIFFSGFQN